MSFRDFTPEEDAAFTEEVMGFMEKKYITDRTPQRFVERVAAIEPNRALAAAAFETDDRTFRRWSNGTSRIPGVAFVALALMERMATQ